MRLSILILAVGLLFAGSANSQSIWKPEPKFSEPATPSASNKMSYRHSAGNVVTATDSILGAWRFGITVAPAGFTLDGVYHAGVGTSIGYQVQDYNFLTQKYTVKHSYNLVWVPLVTGQPITSINNFLMFGATYGFNNNLIQIGPFYYPPGKYQLPLQAQQKIASQIGVMAIIGINLNN